LSWVLPALSLASTWSIVERLDMLQGVTMKLMQKPKLGRGYLPQLKIGLYGLAGTGKTTLLGGFAADPRTSPILWLNCGGNPDLLFLNGTIQFALTLEEMSDILSPLSYLLGGQSKDHEFARTWKDYLPDEPFKTVVVDTFTDFQGLIVDRVTGIKSTDLARYSITSIEAPDPTKHGKTIAAQTLVAARQMLLALPIHVLLGFQEIPATIFQGDGDGRISGAQQKDQINLWGKSRSTVPTWLNLMGRMSWDKVAETVTEVVGGKEVQKRVQRDAVVIRWQDAEAQVKNAISPSLGKHMIMPTAEKILDVIQGDYNNGDQS
jgi:hypothetical protein